MKRAWLPVTLAMTLAAGGCGQKGPLYLPDKKPKVVTAPAGNATPATQPAPPATQPAPPAATPTAAPQTPPAPKPNDKDQDPQQPPK
jgi:predicted small lipoprotein YifL